MGFPSARNYDVNITIHARERWLERIVDPKRYSHLSKCQIPSCGQCITLMHNIRNIITNTRRQIDGRISETFMLAKRAENKVTDRNFLSAMENQHGDLSSYEFYHSLDGRAIFMAQNQDGRLVLFTIMSDDMLDGTTQRVLGSSKEFNPLSSKWKFEFGQRV